MKYTTKLGLGIFTYFAFGIGLVYANPSPSLILTNEPMPAKEATYAFTSYLNIDDIPRCKTCVPKDECSEDCYSFGASEELSAKELVEKWFCDNECSTNNQPLVSFPVRKVSNELYEGTHKGIRNVNECFAQKHHCN